MFSLLITQIAAEGRGWPLLLLFCGGVGEAERKYEEFLRSVIIAAFSVGVLFNIISTIINTIDIIINIIVNSIIGIIYLLFPFL